MTLIAEQWNKNVEIRAKQLENNEDLTYKDIIVPSLLESLETYGDDWDNILDFGCGCGHLTNIIRNNGYKNICGIDISKNSIEYAVTHYPDICFSYTDISSVHTAFNYVVANMVFHSCENVEYIIRSISRLLLRGGHLTFIIPSPQYWLINKGYVNKTEFNYNEHKEYSIPSIAHLDNMENIQVFHRPLEYYIKVLGMYGFTTSVSHIYTKYENPHIVKIDAKRILDLTLSERRLAKLHEMIYMSTDISSKYKQPFYVLLGNRLLNGCKLPSSIISESKKYYKDFIDEMDYETLTKVYNTVKKITLEEYIDGVISMNEHKFNKIRNCSLLKY